MRSAVAILLRCAFSTSNYVQPSKAGRVKLYTFYGERIYPFPREAYKVQQDETAHRPYPTLFYD